MYMLAGICWVAVGLIKMIQYGGIEAGLWYLILAQLCAITHYLAKYL